MTSADDKKSDTKAAAAKPRPKRRYRLVTDLVVLALLAAGAWWGWSVLKPLALEAIAGPAADAMHAVQGLERRLTVLERRLKTAVAERRAAVPIESHELWWIAETERYLTEASARLQSAADVKPALAALKSARQTLEGTTVATADAAKKALNAEIQSLSEYENAAAAQAIATIDALLEQFERGELSGGAPLPPGIAAGGEPAADVERPGVWTRFGDALSRRFKRLIVVERKDSAEARWVTQNVTARSLMLARTAVLGGDGVSYRYAIANALQALRQNDETEGALYAQLQMLHALDVAGTPPPIGEALNEIRALAVELTP